MKVLLFIVLLVLSQTSLVEIRNRIVQDQKVSVYDFNLSNLKISDIIENSFTVTGTSNFPENTKGKLTYKLAGNEVLTSFELLPEKILLSK